MLILYVFPPLSVNLYHKYFINGRLFRSMFEMESKPCQRKYRHPPKREGACIL